MRGGRVVEFARSFLDEVTPLAKGSHREVVNYKVANRRTRRKARQRAGDALAPPRPFSGWRRPAASFVVLLRQNGLHIELEIDHNTLVGAENKAGLADVVLEAALSAIVDLEDSVAAVDAQDKVGVYRNWLGLMKGTLTASLEKKGLMIERRLALDRTYIDRDGGR